MNKELCENVEAFEMQCYRRAMHISYVEHVTNEEVLRRVGQDRGLLGQVKSRKLKYFGHTTKYENVEKDHAGRYARKMSARWSEETVDR